jgi:N-acyl-D-amino-acid deacylase
MTKTSDPAPLRPSVRKLRSLTTLALLALVPFVPFAGCGSDDASESSRTEAGAAEAVGATGVHAPPTPVDLPPSDDPFDWLIEGGEVIDGTGAPARRADVLLRGDRIAHIGIVDADTLEILARFDATGRVVTPGFIDPHAHGSALETPGFPNFLAQGVTTIVLGQDGSSPTAAELPGHMRAVEQAGPSVNVAWLYGHNTLRSESGVGFGVPGTEGLGRMSELVQAALDAGAFGLSLGLEYTPGNAADLEELIEIARPVAARGGVVMSHMRTEDTGDVMGAVEELLEQGRGSGARVHVSHLKVVLGNDPAEARSLLGALDQARAQGVEVTADVYPYLASFTGIAILFPDWARPPNDYGSVVRERRSELAEHLRNRVNSRNGPGATFFGTGPFAGRTLEEAATSRGEPFEDLLIELGPGGARAAYFVMNEEVMKTFLLDPHVAVATDGSPTMGHPRGYGAFARVLSHWAAEEGLFPLEEAVRKMTGLTASILGLDDPSRIDIPRGLLGEGWAADLTVFTPGAIRDRADFEEPHRLAEGMDAVWVSGVPAWHEGAAAAGAGSGRVLRDRGTDGAGSIPSSRP